MRLDDKTAYDVFETIANNDTQKILRFLEKGGAVNAQDGTGRSLLSEAVSVTNLDLVSLFLARGAAAFAS